MLKLLAAASDWLLILLWSGILFFYIRKMRSIGTRSLFLTLFVILGIDAFRALLESAYFGIWHTSAAGILPEYVKDILAHPYMVVAPAIVNLLAAVAVIFLLLRRWIPQAEKEEQQSRYELLESEQRFRAFTNQSIDGIGVADVDGAYTYVNPSFCEMVGYSEEELLTMTVFDVKAEDQEPSSFKKSKEGDLGVPILVKLQRKDGSTFLSEIVGNIIEYGEEKRVLGVVRDVTERENAAKERQLLERQVQHAQKLESLGVLAGGIAHDFNNLLTSMLGNAQLALDVLPSDSPAHRSIREIEEASHHAAELTKQMLDYSGRGRFVVQDIDASGLVEGIAQLLSASISKKIDLKYAFSGVAATFSGDPTQIRQIIMNLITNASEAIGDERGTISLSTGTMDCSRDYLDELDPSLRGSVDTPLPEGRYAYIEVADTGCGMDRDTLDKIFEPFFTTKFTGRGLGMAAVLGIVRGHQGALRVDSVVGEGTTFRVLFPRIEGDGVERDASEGSADAEPRHSSGVVLLVEDEESVRRVGKRMLERLGYEVRTAVDGEDALRVYAELRDELACVLLDLTMPRMGGEEVFREIRSRNPDAKIVLCSGYSEHEATERFIGMGLAGFLHKPYGMKDLEAVLCESLGDTLG
ncbi:MAG: PAS domain S-box protein [Deltaproteobacteria bacterium]|nr:PAS domain S-box protein [Deltaproteobacteria bacterium]